MLLIYHSSNQYRHQRPQAASLIFLMNFQPKHYFDGTIENEPGTSLVVPTNISSPVMPASISPVTICSMTDKYSPVFPNVDMCSAPIASTVFQPATPATYVLLMLLCQ